MNSHKPHINSYATYQLQSVERKKQRDSPTSSILKTPTPIFVLGRRSSVKTKKLKFANGVDTREESYDSLSSTSSHEPPEDRKLNYEQSGFEKELIEVALSPVKKMKVSPESWKAFLEYQKYGDYSSETEKTDYTYSRMSKFRNKEIIPGFRARPNLSRNPINSSARKSNYWSYSFESTPLPQRYTVKTTITDGASTLGGNFEHNNKFELNSLSQNEVSEIIREDSYKNANATNYDDNLSSFKNIGDDSNLLRFRKKSYSYSINQIDKDGSRFGRQWDMDEIDNEYNDYLNTRHNGEVKHSYFGLSRIFGLISLVCATVLNSITSICTTFKDLFSRYILRKKSHPIYYSQYATRSWPRSGTYSVYSKSHHSRLSRWWHQSFLYELYRKIVSTIVTPFYYMHSKYSQTTGRRKIFWFLIPLLLLLALLWYSRAEKDDAFIANQITAFKCKANQYLSPARNQVHTVGRKLSYWWERVFGNSLQPLGPLFKFLYSVALEFLDWMVNLISFAIRYMFKTINLLKNILSRFWMIFIDVFDDAVEKKDNISKALYSFFSDIIHSVLHGIFLVMGIMGNFILALFDSFKSLFLIDQPRQTDKIIVKSDVPERDFSDLNPHLIELRKRIGDLEIELQNMKNEKAAGTELYRKQLEDSYKALQKYQVVVKETLRRYNSKPLQLSKSNIHYYLDGLSDDIKKWINAHFMLKSDSGDIDERKFALLLEKHMSHNDEELKMLQSELSSLRMDLNNAQFQDLGSLDLPLNIVKRIVADAIKLHDADKTGKVDFALESAGGRVLSVKCTEPYDYCLKYSDMFGWRVCAQTRKNSPEQAINPGMTPGQCWAFVGSQGYLVLKLSHNVVVSGFTMEHLSRLLSPNGRIDSAPRKFTIWGLQKQQDPEPHLFGHYEYKDNNETYQYFPVMNYTSEPYSLVELNIESNHGNPNYTCLYRIRVHGEVPGGDIYPSHL